MALQADRSGEACVVMAHGFSLPRHDGLADYAERLAAAGPPRSFPAAATS